MINSSEKFWINLSGNSMFPVLRDQDQVLIDPVPYEKLFLGDVILIRDFYSSELVIHRLIEFPMKTKGDFSLVCETNPPDAYLGRACGYLRSDIIKDLPNYHGLYLFFSKMRMSNYFTRKIALLGLLLTTVFWKFYSAKTT